MPVKLGDEGFNLSVGIPKRGGFVFKGWDHASLHTMTKLFSIPCVGINIIYRYLGVPTT